MVSQHAIEPTHVRLSKYEHKYGAHHSTLMDEPVLSQVLSRGYCVIPNYWSADQCETARSSIDSIMLAPSNQGIELWQDALSADKRIMGANHLSPSLDLFTDEKITHWMKALYGVDHLVGFSMAARLDALQGNLGSGQGWHRDSCIEHQYKAILYLSDVDSSCGPFQYYHRSGNAAEIIEFEKNANVSVDQSRLDDYQASFDGDKINELCALEGTLILANTRGIHRGKPIENGRRYALTNYYWKQQIPEHISKFVNLPKHENGH